MKRPTLLTTAGLLFATGHLAFAKGAPPQEGADWNDRISSAYIGENLRVVLFEDAGFAGERFELLGKQIARAGNGAFPDLAAPGWGDRAGSLKVLDGRSDREGRAPGSTLRAVFYADAEYLGQSFSLAAGEEVADLASVRLPGESADYRVHEWGTFTMLQGSDGVPVAWYQAPDKLVDLPPFVARAFFGKSGTGQGLDIVRMETPVLYFYPGEQMDISVAATYNGGRITEIFPHAQLAVPGMTQWRGTLLPPDSPERAFVPAADGPTGAHYAAARAVPDAWLFRAHPHPPRAGHGLYDPEEETPEAGSPDRPEPIDHFIFYRGAGDSGSLYINIRQGSTPGEYTLANYTGHAVPKLFALRVRDGQSAWLALDDLLPIDYADGKAINHQTFAFPAPAGPTPEVAASIRAAMVDELDAEGLTRAEAEAMVATWDDLWFTEPGTRVLAVLPQAIPDSMLPLEIQPAPAAVERVFVGRYELFTREQEAELMALVNAPGAGDDDPVVAADELRAMQLGRYAAGGAERAMTLVRREMQTRFAKLTRLADERERAREEVAAAE